MQNFETNNKPHIFENRYFNLGVLAFAFIVLTALVSLALSYRDLQVRLKTANETISKLQQPQNDDSTLIQKVGQLITLPQEQPTIATVADLSKLQDQPFFANAKVGDKVLLYTQAKEVILYRPSENKIIQVGPLTNTAASAAASNTASK